MTDDQRTAEWITCIRELEATPPKQRGRASERLLNALLAEARELLGASFDEKSEAAYEIAEIVTLKLVSSHEHRNRVLSADHPLRCVRRMMVNAIVDVYRKRRCDDFEQLSESVELHVEDQGKFLEVLEAADTVGYLWQKMTEEEQELLRLRFWKDLSFRDIADRLGITYGAATKRMHRVLVKLRTIAQERDVPGREAEVLHLTAAGLAAEEIADRLHLPIGTRRAERGPRPHGRKGLAAAGERSDASPGPSGSAIERFHRLAAAWRENRGPVSSLSEMAMRPEYQQIIGMGRDAVPLLLQELRNDPDHWFWALVAITGEDPVPREHKGSLSKMAQAWLEWGRDHGYLESDAT